MAFLAVMDEPQNLCSRKKDMEHDNLSGGQPSSSPPYFPDNRVGASPEFTSGSSTARTLEANVTNPQTSLELNGASANFFTRLLQEQRTWMDNQQDKILNWSRSTNSSPPSSPAIAASPESTQLKVTLLLSRKVNLLYCSSTNWNKHFTTTIFRGCRGLNSSLCN